MDEVLEYIRLRLDYHYRVRKVARKNDKSYIDAQIRELQTVERFVTALGRVDTAEVVRMQDAMRQMVIQSQLDI